MEEIESDNSLVKEMEQLISFESDANHMHSRRMFVTTPIQQIRLQIKKGNGPINSHATQNSEGLNFDDFDNVAGISNAIELKKPHKLVNFKIQKPDRKRIVRNKSLGVLIKQRQIVPTIQRKPANVNL